uniref:Dynein attachment factor N-terminal domain-containing protein n=1 Tax=Megaselia scalaris TaxID=36166 RepID=T1GN05_MEGSC
MCENLITNKDLNKLETTYLENLQKERIYYLRNDAKIKAVTTTSSYDEFKDIVDAAHLKPISKADKNKVHTKSRLWNSAVNEE